MPQGVGTLKKLRGTSSLGSPKEASLGEQLLNARLEDRLGLEVVHSGGLRLALERRFCVAGQADDVGLGKRGCALVEELPYLNR